MSEAENTTKKTRTPRAKKAVWVLLHETSGDLGIREECNSTEEALDWVRAKGLNGMTYHIVTIQKEVTVKHETQVKVTLA